MTLAMSRSEREGFLAQPHVGIVSIAEAGRAGLVAPIWYGYTPERGVWLITAETSRKGKLLAQSRRFALCVQNAEPPAYQYVSVEGPVVEVRSAALEEDYRPMAHRYLGPELGDRFADGAYTGHDLLYVMRPERWLTADYSKDSLLGD